MSEVSFRPGAPEPGEAARWAWLANVAAGGGLARLYGRRWQELLSTLYLCEETTLSHRRALIAVAGDRIVGALTCFGFDEQVECARATRETIRATLGWRYLRPHAIAWLRRLRGIRIGDVRPGELHLFCFAVEPEWRRRGIGARMVALAEAAARERSCARLTADVARQNTASTGFVARLGFATDRAPGSARTRVLRLTKELR